MLGGQGGLENALVAYREALQERTRERVPLDWAATQNDLGRALVSTGVRGDDAAFTDAIAAYREALKERTRERVPTDWAATQYNLGTALWILSRGGDASDRRDAIVALGDAGVLDDAIVALHEALKERTRERFPLSWAETQDRLGNALEDKGDLTNDPEIWGEAASHYALALEVYEVRLPPVAYDVRPKLARVTEKISAAREASE